MSLCCSWGSPRYRPDCPLHPVIEIDLDIDRSTAGVSIYSARRTARRYGTKRHGARQGTRSTSGARTKCDTPMSPLPPAVTPHIADATIKQSQKTLTLRQRPKQGKSMASCPRKNTHTHTGLKQNLSTARPTDPPTYRPTFLRHLPLHPRPRHLRHLRLLRPLGRRHCRYRRQYGCCCRHGRRSPEDYRASPR